MKTKPRLLASSHSEEMIKESIEKYFYSKIELVPVNENEWQVKNSIRVIDSVRVVRKKGRYRFEAIES